QTRQRLLGFLAGGDIRIRADDRDFVVHAIDRQKASDPNYQVFEYRERNKEGHWVWIECRGACVEWDENGVPTRIIG
ncbi:PAS domain-containing protein, partial [Rhizobium leguminosarum]|uniref:PAS domain-containing protein n=1 Tax=Rhizobium leguminosarum TaxID=384 RepID=UPI003F9E8F2F